MAKKGYSAKGFFGQINHYDEDGNKIGESTRGFWGQANHYDTEGNKVGESTRGFMGQVNHYDVNGNKKIESVRNFWGGVNHYDEDGNKIGYSTPGFFGGSNHYEWRNKRLDGFKYGVYPENYETEEEYDIALKKVKQGYAKVKNIEVDKNKEPSLMVIILIDIVLFALLCTINP